MRPSDIRVLEAEPHFSTERAREPYKFGNAVMDHVTLCHVRLRVQNRRGNVAEGWGAIFLSHFWAFTSSTLSQERKDAAMQHVARAFCELLQANNEYGHPVDLFLAAEHDLAKASAEVAASLSLGEPIPFLAALVSASPADAALHDAFGKVNGRSTYDLYDAASMSHDLGHYFDGLGVGRSLDLALRQPTGTVPIFHSVGGLDRLTAGEMRSTAPNDGLPVSLEEWIERDRLFCLKIKLLGVDLVWDLERCVSVWRVAQPVLKRQGRRTLYLSLDPNEQCAEPQYVIDLLHQLREIEPEAFGSILFVEQPTGRDLRRNRFDMRPLAEVKPVMIDESLTSLDDVDLAIELGWSGVAIKTCKCHTMALLTAAKAKLLNLPICVQDLTNPGLASLHSVGLTSRLYALMGVEANARQYYPSSSRHETAVHPEIFRVHDGVVRTASLSGPGLGYQIERIDRPIFRGHVAVGT
jgi:L-alanine-DL-glutamate epimerase-like enolase superfamily enzyme